MTAEPKVAIVTGGSQGIGRALVETLLAHEYRVATCARHIAAEDKPDLLANRLGRRPMIMGACIAQLVLAIPCMLLVNSRNNALIFVGLMLLAIPLVSFTSSMPATLPALFYTPVRYRSMSIVFNLSVSLFGGTTPLFTAWLVGRSAAGDPLRSDDAYFMISPTFETTSKKYGWLNDVVAVGKMVSSKVGPGSHVTYDIFVVK